MWFWRWWRWMRGEVIFQAQGGLCERFLNLLLEAPEPVTLWDVQWQDGEMTASCRAADYARLRPFAARTGTRVRVIGKHGFPFVMRPFRHRGGLLIGAALALMLYMVLSSHIWVVDVELEEGELREKIIAQLSVDGVGIGSRTSAVDTATVQLNAIAQIEEIHRLSVYFEGSVAHVEVTLSEEGASLPDTSPANVVAAHDGRIVSMQVTSGQAMVKPGEAVVAGDLLVCGAVETDAGILLRHATGVITAQTTRTFSHSVSLSEELPRMDACISQPTFCFFTWRLPLYSPCVRGNDGWEVKNKRSFMTLFDTTLPLGIEETIYTHMAPQTVTHTKAEAEQLAKERLAQQANETLADAEIIGVQSEGCWEGEVYHLTETYSCIENIALTVPMLSDFE